MNLRAMFIGAATVALVALGVAVATAVRPAAGPREIVLTARGMSFYVDGDASPNPTIRVRAGEHVRFVLHNEAPGLVHDLTIPGLGVTLEPIEAGASRAAVLRIPVSPGTFPYSCRPHARMMQGTVVVAGN